MKNRKRAIILGAALAVLIAAGLWYTRPQSWTSVTTEGETRFSAWLEMADPDWDSEAALYPINYLRWELTKKNAEGETAQAILHVLDGYTYRRSLSSLIPRQSYSITGRPDVITMGVMWDEGGHIYTFYSDGTVHAPSNLGFDIYHFDPALFDQLAQLIQTYGTPQEV